MTASAESVLTSLQLVLLVPLAIFGLHRGWLVLVWARARRSAPAPSSRAVDAWPEVTVQIPIFNERLVAARVIASAAALDYPRDRLEIQVLDDSTDDTSERVRLAMENLPPDLRITHLRRGSRDGFKSGALAAGLAQSAGELITVFDADFLPPPDFLRRTVPWFAAPDVGVVQARWGHLNADRDLLTDVQRTLLDAHFVVEHTARDRLGCWFNFNGTAGVIRRTCVVDAGGWQHDTLTEDLDLSYRAHLRGWRFVYLPELVCPAELPTEMNAFLTQQHRWAKGAIQTARKLLGRVVGARLALRVKAEACFHLLGGAAFPLLLALIAVALPLEVARAGAPAALGEGMRALDAAALGAAAFCLAVYYLAARSGAGSLRWSTPLLLPVVIALGAGTCVSNTTAVLAGLRRTPGEFVRTPKCNAIAGRRAPPSYSNTRGLLPFVECGCAVWAAATSTLAAANGNVATAVFHGLFAGGLAWTGGASLREAHRKPAAEATRDGVAVANP